MWDIYRRRFVTMQLMIIGFCLVTRLYFHSDWPVVGICFVVMQVFSIIGAAWGNTLQKKLAQAKDEPPLARK